MVHAPSNNSNTKCTNVPKTVPTTCTTTTIELLNPLNYTRTLVVSKIACKGPLLSMRWVRASRPCISRICSSKLVMGMVRRRLLYKEDNNSRLRMQVIIGMQQEHHLIHMEEPIPVANLLWVIKTTTSSSLSSSSTKQLLKTAVNLIERILHHLHWLKSCNTNRVSL